MNNGKAKGLGIKTDTKVTKDINRAVQSKQQEAIRLNNDWRDAVKENPDILKTTTFPEFKKEWHKKQKSNLGNYKNQQYKDSLSEIEKKHYKKVQSEYRKKCYELPHYKEAVSFHNYLVKRAPELEELEQIELEKLRVAEERIKRDEKYYKKYQKQSKAPTFWEKIDDPVYKSALTGRGSNDPDHPSIGESLSNHWGVGKAKFPN
jgi:hypothetical protein